MSEKLRNVICEPKDLAKDIKRQLLEFISLNQTVCNNLPDLSLPDLTPDISLSPSQKIIDILLDILALLSGINFDEMRMQLIKWLIEELKPLSEDLSIKFIEAIKSCYACKIEPTIPEWLFQIQPSTILFDVNGDPIPNTGTPGIGINIELNKIDLKCIFATDPNSDVGKLLYDGNSTEDISAFLWDAIQADGDPLIWNDPTNNKPIFEVRYLEDSPTAFINTDGTVEYQNIDPTQRVFNFRIVNSTYQNKSIVTFLIDYFNSQQPLFDVENVIPNVIDLLYGTLTNKIDLPDECLLRNVELEKSIEDYSAAGADNVEVTFDDSFYTFNEVDLVNIKEKVKQKKLGVRRFKNCCGKETSSISFGTLNRISGDISNASTLQERVTTYTKSIDTLSIESTKNVKNLDKDGASGEFMFNFMTSLEIAIVKLTLSPKNMMILNLFNYLVNGKSTESDTIKGILKEFECVLRCIIAEIIRNIVYKFLLPMIIKTLKNLIICTITKKIKEKHINYLKSKLSLLPGFINENLETVNELLGKGENLVDKARGFTDKINLDSLNNINLQFNRKNRFCD